MKQILLKKHVWQSVLSAIILGVFAYFALASLGAAQQKRYLGNGQYEIAKFYGRGNAEIIQGPVDDHGNWHGTTTFRHEGEDGVYISTEEVNMTNGLRNGISKTTFSSGRVYTVCYEMGERVDCDKSAVITVAEKSAYEIFSYKYPWMMTKLDAFGFAEEEVKAFIDTFETLINANEFDIADFDDYYDDISDILAETPYDSIIEANAEIAYFNGIDLSQFDEFRYAVHDQFRSESSTTFDVVKQTYTNYLLQMNTIGISDADFMRFCAVFDSIMQTYEPLVIEDPDLIDSLDNRMFATISYLMSDYEGSIVADEALKSLTLDNVKMNARNMGRIADHMLSTVKVNVTPSEVSSVVVSLILLKYYDGDKIRLALMDSYAMRHGVVTLPTVITGFQGRNSSSSVTLSGNVTGDGGGEISSRGFYWGTGFNPDVTNNSIMVNSGTGSFNTEIDGLSEGVTYYARSFAANSAGIAYGNCVKFTTSDLVSAEITEFEDTELNIYPNPASGLTTFNFQVENTGKMELSIINLNGQVVMQKELIDVVSGSNHLEINLSHLENGVYTGRILINNSKQINRKFVIAR